MVLVAGGAGERRYLEPIGVGAGAFVDVGKGWGGKGRGGWVGAVGDGIVHVDHVAGPYEEVGEVLFEDIENWELVQRVGGAGTEGDSVDEIGR